MRKVFRSKFKITQTFANKLIIDGKEYYKQWGLSGHEGLDLVPTGIDWDIHALEGGVVVKDEDVGRNNYGKYLTIWSPAINKATQYCHLNENYFKLGDKVKREDKIGRMGDSGNTFGAHLHLNLFNVDENGYRLNKDNGYLGGIDPLPFIKEEVSDSSNLIPVDPIIIAQSDIAVAVATKLKVPVDKDIILAEIDKMLTYEDKLEERAKEIEIKNNQLAETQEKATELENSIDTLQEEINDVKTNYKAVEDVLDAVSLKAEQLQRDKQDLQDQLNQVKPDQGLTPKEYLILFLKSIGLMK